MIKLTLYICFFLYSVSAAGHETLIAVRGNDFVLFGADSSLVSNIAVTSSKIDKIHIIANPFPQTGTKERRFDEQQIVAVAAVGEPADCDKIVRLLKRHVAQYEYEAGIGCDVKCVYGSSDHIYGSGLHAEAVANIARGQIAKSLRSKDRLSTSLLIGGMVPSLHNNADILVDNVMGDSFERVKRQVVNSMDALGPSSEKRSNEKESEETHVDTSMKMLLQPKLFWLDEYGSIQSIKYGAHGLGSNFVLSILDRGYSKDITKQQALDLINECFAQLKKRFLINSPDSPCIKCIGTDGCNIL